MTVVGQGYVGLPLAMAISQAGFTVFGFDSDNNKITLLQNGCSLIEDVDSELIKNQIKDSKYIPTFESSSISESSIVLICVPTPLDSSHKPDLSSLISAATTVGQNLKIGSLVIIESTIEPGTCRTVLLPLLLRVSGLNKDDFTLAYSPERIDPANTKWNIKNTPKLIAGTTKLAASQAAEFYNKFIDVVHICSSLEVAEAAKLLENTFRLVNISLINELSMYFAKIGIDSDEVVKAAATKPYGFMPFYPSIGAGGHCIPVDPIYLATSGKKVGASTRFIDLADQINQEMPGYFVGRAEKKISGLQGKKVLVVGVSYKPNVADVRESPAAVLITGLKQKGAQVFWHDDLVKAWNGEESVALSSDFDLAIIATPHDYLNLSALGNMPILHTRGAI